MIDKPPILVWHGKADAYRAALLERLPDVSIDTAGCPPIDSGSGAPAATTAPVLLAWEIPAGALASMPELAWIQCTGAGVDHFLEREDLPDNVVLTRSLSRFGIQVAEYTVGYLLHHLLDIDGLHESQRRRAWERIERPLLADLTVGIIGLGSLGLPTARVLAAFGTRVLGVRRSGDPVDGIERVFGLTDWKSMLPECDALVVAAPRTPATTGMIDAEALAALPRGALVINVARGDLIEESALVAALANGHLGGAALDVFWQEPLPTDHPLWGEPRARVTPHIAAPSEVEPIADEFADNYRRFVRGEPLLNVVDREGGY